MKKWQGFEQLVACIHQLLNATDYDVEHDVTVSEPSGASHQVDVYLRPKTGFAGPILVSCKAWAEPVGVDHVREWSDIVQHTGAAAGVIVAMSGFTSGAVDAARNKERRISLWRPRPLTPDDFAPDEKSTEGYIAHVTIQGELKAPRIIESTFTLDAPRADGKPPTREVQYQFSVDNREQWYLRDSSDNLVGNLVDLVVGRAKELSDSGSAEIVLNNKHFLVLGGVRLVLRRVAFDVEVVTHKFSVEVDLFRDAFGYENILTGDLKIVPLPMFDSFTKSKNARSVLGLGV